MARDVNLSVLTGTVISTPTLIPIRGNKHMLLFTVSTVEKFVNAAGVQSQHDNEIPVEVLGRNAESFHKTVLRGERYLLTGYLRVDDLNGVERMRVRLLSLQPAD